MAKAKTQDWLERDIPETLPVMPLKSVVPFPMSVFNVQIAIPQNLRLLKAYPSEEAVVAIGVMLDPEGPFRKENLSRIALACRVINRIKMADGTMQIALQGIRRIHIVEYKATKPFLKAKVACFEEPEKQDGNVPRLTKQVMSLIDKLVELDQRYPDEVLKVLKLNIENGSRFSDLVPTVVQFSYAKKRLLLETTSVAERLENLSEFLRSEIAKALVSREMEEKTEITIQQDQREAFLRRQLEVIRAELGEQDPMAAELAVLEKKIKEADLPPLAHEEAMREIQRLRSFGPRSSESSIIRTYLDWIISLPWHKTTKDRIQLRRVRKALDQDHYGLEKVKERIVEFLAVRKLGGTGKGSVLCIVGPPGTGKTTLGESVARALGREYMRISLGGVTDQAEIRGHRRTYVGAMPGRILEGLRRAQSKNPVLVIDEIDKLESGPQGDPASALLEVLDPEQNQHFLDHYLGVPFDLSQVLFVATANLEDYIPEALLDRLEVIYLSGYTEMEKISIARKHIWPRVLREHGLGLRRVNLTKQALIKAIRLYTQEAGVRELTRTLETICRKVAAKVAGGSRARFSINPTNLKKYLGPPIFEQGETEKRPEIGIVTGLAWTAGGGDILPIEALTMPGDGRTILTGYLGEVMRESVAAAFSYVKSRSEELGINPENYKKQDIHIHFPEGAIPKDGPSAGIAVATAIASLLSRRPVLPNLAMTGEISLRGKVLSVGGIKEKVLAAYRIGIRQVILPEQNRNDLTQIPKEIKRKIKFHFVEHVDKVFQLCLASRRRNVRKSRKRAKKARPRRRAARRK